MNPIRTKELIRDSIIDNINRFTPVADVCQGNMEAEAFGKEFQEMVNSYPYVSEPYIERIPFYRQQSTQSHAISTTLASMVKTSGAVDTQGEHCIPCIEQETAELFAAYFGHATKKEDIHPERFRLYEHQVLAAQAVDEGKNLIVSTGTGSGKTESFLIPVLNAIIAERKHCRETGKCYTPGVRAMILYPMNALVADQLRRIRDILRAAEQCGIPYAEEITFGMYTGEVETLQGEEYQEKRLRRENGAAYGALRHRLNDIETETKAMGIQTEHPYLSNDSSIANEYTARSDWENNQAADILITNYSMLERLMLDPARNPLFSSDTWKFIVLDEAHTYDGGTGTEIAWLMRRLTKRISTKKRPLQYIATSATMFPKGEIEQAQEFGAELFPAEKDSFSVQEGMRQQAIYETREIPTAAFPLKNWKTESFRIDAEAFLEKVGHQELNRLRAQSPRTGKEENLYTFTLWYQQAQEWLSGMSYLHRFAQTHQASPACSLGDLLAICRLLADFAPGERLVMRLKSDNKTASLIQQFVKHLIETDKKNYLLSVIRNTQSIRQEKDVTDAYEALEKFSQDGAAAELPVIYWVSVVTMLYEKCNIFTLLADDSQTAYAPLRWPVEPESMPMIQEIHTRLSEAEQALGKLGNLLVLAWQKALGNNAVTLPDIVSSYLLQFKEFYLLEKALEGGGHIKWELAERIFHGDEAAFDIFASLLTLSRHPELKSKPLMDLRFHQCVGGMSTVGVWFEHSADGHVQAHLLPDEEKQHHEDDEGNLHPVYTLSVCAKCGQPYLSGYVRGHFAQDDSDADHGKKLPFVRYSGRQQEEEYWAFTWLKGNQAETMLAADSGEPESKYWLCYDTGIICKQTARPTDPCIPLCYAAGHRNEQNDTAPTHIAACPVCGGIDVGSQRGEYGIIAPFKTHETVTRNVALYAMCETADKQFSLSGTPQGGKKVLAFSDSRYKAAAVSVYFEAFMKTRVVEEGILKNISPIEEDCAEIMALKNYFQTPHLPEAVKTYIAGQIAERENKPGAKVLRYPTLTEVAAKLRRHLAETGGLKQLRYIYEQNERTHEFSELNGAVLAALTCLRKSARNSVLNRRLVAVRPRFISMQEDDVKWRNWCTLFPDTRAAEAVFLDILAILYMKAELYCRHLPDNEVGPEREHYTQAQIPDAESEVRASFYVNGCERWDRQRVVMQAAQNALCISPGARNKIIKLTKSKLHDPDDITAACSCLWDLLRHGDEDNQKILVQDENHQYLLNINAICYSPTERTATDTRPMSINTVYRAEEHTAQIELEKGKLYQSLFAEGKINVLSCSTTFEMGVDLGSLNSVFLCNMPPTVANYTQRAGRAGRRAGSASHVITFMGTRPHDQYYRKRPEELFFGTLKSPHLYLSNVSYRAKHLRAEALHDFLQYCVAHRLIAAQWNKTGAFFSGLIPQRSGNQVEYTQCSVVVEHLEAWEKNHAEEVQRHCEDLVGEKLPYSVAADLCYQLTGKPDKGGETVAELSRELSGPHISGNPHARPLCERYKERENTLKEHQEEKDKLVHLYSIATTDYLAQNRLLPIYGFPCDVIELEPHQDDEHSPRLSRDKRVGIYEYAPGKRVLADKRIYQSREPVFYHQRAGNQILTAGSRDKVLYRCPACLSFSESADSACLVCGHNAPRIEMRFYSPDAFRANKSEAATGVVYDDKGINCRSLYPASDSLREQEAYPLPGSNILMTAPAKKEIHYLNTDAPWRDIANTTQYEGIFHTVQTDFLFLTAQTELAETLSWSETRRRHAWESAAQAIAKAAARELQIQERDLEAMTTRSRGGTYNIVLIDNTTNGSGILLPLLEVCEKKQESSQADLIRGIFRRAVSICTESDCSCSRQEEKRIPLTHEEYLSLEEKDKATHREYTACYLCLKGYSNQMLHGTLDAHDAAVILRAMMSEGTPQGETVQDGVLPKPNPTEVVPSPVLSARRQTRDFTEEVMRGIIDGTIPSPARLMIKYQHREISARYIGKNNLSQYIIKIDNKQLYFPADELQKLIK